jgi:hypothetical protein
VFGVKVAANLRADFRTDHAMAHLRSCDGSPSIMRWLTFLVALIDVALIEPDRFGQKSSVLSLCTQARLCTMQTTKVGIREFRENLSSFLESKTPVAITRHGATIGIYVPTKPKPSQADLEALRVAGEKMQELIAAAGTTEDELVEDFRKLRRERRMKKS